jgi:4-hydroxy-tetrahydrodipicolinate synthase
VPGIIGIKDATANIERGTDLIKRAPRNFAIYSGDDAAALALILLGGHGVISVTANVAPRAMHDMSVAALAGDAAAAARIDAPLAALHRDLFVESNPIPVKWALAEMGLIAPGIRLPLTPLAAAYHATVRAALAAAGVVTGD